MSKIVIGDSSGKDLRMDLDVLLRTRLLIQANSGKGKSWLLRRLAEQLFGKVQVIIIDPEGEFATLREKFDFVLVGKGGETAAHPRIAAMTAQRLLELRACAVIDLYEMKPSERHSYVRLFLESMIDAPKNLWHPVVIILDEAHVYCPEKGAGESEAADSVIGMATRGRKRGYCLIPATQRLGKFRKDAAAEMLNVAIGGTFIDIDRKRAADALGVYGPDIHKFFDEIRLLDRGIFYCLGPAISTERVMVEVGPVETTHPEAGSARHAAEAPPTPDKIKALLPKLADLPKEAEDRAKSIADLQKENRQLKAELKARPSETKTVTEEKIVEVPVLRDDQIIELQNVVKVISGVASIISEALGRAQKRPQPAVVRPHPVHVQTRPTPRAEPSNGNGDTRLNGPQQRILDACAWLESIGVAEPKQTAVAFLSGYTVGGGAFNNPRGALRQMGLIDYRGESIVLTEAGRELARTPEASLNSEELQQRVFQQLPTPEQKILRPLLAAYPDSIDNDELARSAGYEPGGGAYNNPRGRLRSLGLVEYPQKGMVKAADLLFLN